MNIVAIGRSEMLYHTIIKLNERHTITAIVTDHGLPEYSITEQDFQTLATDLNIPYFSTPNLTESEELHQIISAADLGISVNWAKKIPQDILNAFRIGILNSHNGDLPKYRGNACANWAILNKETEVINSVHFMDGNAFDCGRVIVQGKFKLTERSTIQNVFDWAEATIPKLFLKAVDLLEKKPDYLLKMASESDGFRCYPRIPEDGFIDWEKSAEEIDALIRASGVPYSGAYTYLIENQKFEKLICLKSRVAPNDSSYMAVPGHLIHHDKRTGESSVCCGRGTLVLQECLLVSENKRFKPASRWSSIRLRLGARFEDWFWSQQTVVKGALKLFP